MLPFIITLSTLPSQSPTLTIFLSLSHSQLASSLKCAHSHSHLFPLILLHSLFTHPPSLLYSNSLPLIFAFILTHLLPSHSLTLLPTLTSALLLSPLSQLLEGNTNTYQPQTSQLSPPIIATRVRFVPYSEHPRIVCMRVELYGCRYTGQSLLGKGKTKFHALLVLMSLWCDDIIIKILEISVYLFQGIQKPTK